VCICILEKPIPAKPIQGEFMDNCDSVSPCVSCIVYSPLKPRIPPEDTPNPCIESISTAPHSTTGLLRPAMNGCLSFLKTPAPIQGVPGHFSMHLPLLKYPWDEESFIIAAVTRRSSSGDSTDTDRAASMNVLSITGWSLFQCPCAEASTRHSYPNVQLSGKREKAVVSSLTEERASKAVSKMLICCLPEIWKYQEPACSRNR